MRVPRNMHPCCMRQVGIDYVMGMAAMI